MKVTIANDYTNRQGTSYKAGQTVEVEDVEGRTLIHKGKAVEASPHSRAKKPATADTSAAAETTTPTKGKGKE